MRWGGGWGSDNKISFSVTDYNFEFKEPTVNANDKANASNTEGCNVSDINLANEHDNLKNSKHGDGIYSAPSKESIVFKGRLAKNIAFWEKISNSEVVLDIVRHGYRLPFISLPESKFMQNNKSAVDHSDFVESSILDLLKIGSIMECSEVPYIINPLTVSVNDEGKERLILDL